MKTFPINLVLKKLPILVIGGGTVAEEKIRKILPFKPRITVVSPKITVYLKKLITNKKIFHHHAIYKTNYLQRQQLVIAATNNKAINEQIFNDAQKQNLLVNTVDDPELCNFIFPAIITGDHFTLSIGTNGKAAGVSKKTREELEDYLRGEDQVLEVIEKIRKVFKKKYTTIEKRRDKLMHILKQIESK